jgi:putative tryptophan/tyrosine transport system substrate-binding protein
MTSKILIWLTVFLLNGAFALFAQSTKTPRIGFLIATSPGAIEARLQAFRQALVELEYVEGKNITLDYRWAEGKVDRLPELAGQLVAIKTDILLSTGPQSTRAAQTATATIPIVMAFDNDPVGNGFVASLAHPGGNITGLSTLAPNISGKQLELLKEILPRLSRVMVFETSTQPGNSEARKEIQLAGKSLGLKLEFLDLQTLPAIDAAFAAASKSRADAVLVLNSPSLNSQRPRTTELAAKSRLPSIYWATEFVEAGGLMTYGVSFTDLYRRAASYVDKILKGRKAAELPIEQPRKFEFIVNLKAAKQIGLTIPPNVLARADRVIR